MRDEPEMRNCFQCEVSLNMSQAKKGILLVNDYSHEEFGTAELGRDAGIRPGQPEVNLVPRRSSSHLWFYRGSAEGPAVPRLSRGQRDVGDGRTWREGVLSLQHRRCNETHQYHPTQQSPHEDDWLPGNENPHGRTSGDEERLTITTIILRNPQTHFRKDCARHDRQGSLGQGF